MAQLGRFTHTVANSSTGRPVNGASVTIYREGATVNGAQAGTSPFLVTVRHIGKLKDNDTVFINEDTSTTYTCAVTESSGTAISLSGFLGTLSLRSDDRIIPINNKPAIYLDDQGGTPAPSPLQTSATGLAECHLEAGAYDYLVSGGGVTTTLFHAMVVPTEALGQVRYADAFASSLSSTGGIQEAITDIASTGGRVILSGNKTYSVASTIDISSNDITIEGGGDSTLLQMSDSAGVHFFGTQGSGITGSRFTARNFKMDGVNSTKTNGRGFNFGTCSDALIENVSIFNTCDAAIGSNAAGPSTTTRLRVLNCRIDNPGDAGSADGYGIILNNASDCLIKGNYIVSTLHASIFGFGTSTNNIIVNNRVESGENGIRWGSSGQACSHWIVANNEVDGCSVDGIRADGSNAIVIGNRSINNTNSGIKSDGPLTSSLWANNYCKSNANKGIYLNPANGAVSDVLIIGNLCDSNTGDGIRISPFAHATNAMVNVVVRNNMSINNGTYGLYVDAAVTASSFVVADNTYRNNTTAAELLENATTATFGPTERLKFSGYTAAATLLFPGDGTYTVAGTADITSITACPTGTRILIIFSGTAATNGVVDGSNLKIAGNFAYSPNDTLELVCDGTNWYEIGRSAN